MRRAAAALEASSGPTTTGFMPILRRWASSSRNNNNSGHQSGQTSSETAASPVPKWTGGGVFGVALVAGLLGWGIASATLGPAQKSTWRLDSVKQFPRYASMKEMEIVSNFLACTALATTPRSRAGLAVDYG